MANLSSMTKSVVASSSASAGGEREGGGGNVVPGVPIRGGGSSGTSCGPLLLLHVQGSHGEYCHQDLPVSCEVSVRK